MDIRKKARRWCDERVQIGLLVSLISACSSALSVRSARSGDLAGMKAAIAQERAQGKLSRGRVEDIAREVGNGEIRRAPASDAIARIDDARACARQLSDALDERAGRSDDAAVAATLALLETRAPSRRDGDLVRRHGQSPNPLWRAVAAAAASEPKFGKERRGFYVDPDERVRLAALRAALDAPDPSDGAALAEVARRDPNPVAQGLAARALGGIANAEAVFALRDLYAGADEGLRQSIVDAWGRPAAASAGGVRELVAVAENQEGAVAVEAGGVLLRFGPEEAAVGKRALLKGMNRGLSRDRVLAIGRVSSNDPEMAEALRKAAQSDDVAVKTAALARLADAPATRAQSFAELRKIADGGSSVALFALARAGDPAAVEGVAKDLTSRERSTRLAAAAVLIDAERFAQVADVLADPDPHVRMSVSCSILVKR